MQDVIISNNILQSEYKRDANHEFPKRPVVDFVFSWIRDLISVHRDNDLISDWSSRRTLKASELLSNSIKVAYGLKQRGLVSGDIICCLIHSEVDYFSILLGAWLNSCVVAALQHSFDQELLLSVLRKSRSKVIFTDKKGAARCLAAQKESPYIAEIIVLDESRECTPFKNILNERQSNIVEDEEQPRNYNPDETIAIVFSSGTTGTPKGILLTHQNIYSFLLTARPKVNRPGMKTLFVPRLGNVLGLLFGLRSLLIYSHLHVLSNYSDEHFLNAIKEVQPTRMLIYLPHILAMIEHPNAIAEEMSSVEAVFTAGTLISKQLQAQLNAKLPNLKTFFTFYGMTEVAVGTMYPFVDYEENEHNVENLRKRFSSNPHSVGRLAPMNQLKVIDETTGEILGPKLRGELCFKGPSAFKGYWDDSESTNRIKQDGWVHTGDIGYYDEDGDVYLISRSKELIKYLGHHVIPLQLESILKSHPAVEDAAVIGMPHEKYGELPTAFVLKKDVYKDVEAGHLIEFVNRKVHDECHLRGGLYFIEKIPRNVMGKIVRIELQVLSTNFNNNSTWNT